MTFRVALAVLSVGAALVYFAVVPRNAFVWMAGDLAAGGTLPVDDLQGAKELGSFVLLALSLGALGLVALGGRILVGGLCAVAVLVAWHQLFWSLGV